jgi:polar amino acid transport system substrate-binding protein
MKIAPRIGIWIFSLALATPLSASEWHFVTEDFPPFTYATGKHALGARHGAGPLTEIVETVCARLQQTCSIAVHPWRRALAMAENGDADGIFTVVRSPEREQHFYITRMLITSRYSVFAHASSPFVFHEPQDMAGHVIGVYGPSGTSYVLSQRLHAVPDIDLRLTASNRRLLRMLDSGRFGRDGLVVANQDVAWSLIDSEQLNSIHETGELQSVEYGIGLSRKNVSPEQFQAFAEALDAEIAQGTVPAILRRYELEAVTP